MLKGKKLLAVVPARGGSKGVPRKNIYPLLGVPLVAHVGALVRELNYVDRAIISTNDPEIAEVARSSGLDVPFYRPKELSGDLVGVDKVLNHALTEMERLDNTLYDIVVMLQPTSPLRSSVHVTSAITKLIDEGWDAVWTVSETDLHYHPLKQLKVDHDGTLDYYDPQGAMIIARQQLSPVYHVNGAAYVFTRECLLDQKTMKGRQTGAVVIDEPMVSIDTLEDFELAESLLTQHREQKDERKK